MQEIWQRAMGRYDRAMKNLVVDVLNETENPVENLVQSLEKMTSDSSQKAAETIQKGDIHMMRPSENPIDLISNMPLLPCVKCLLFSLQLLFPLTV